MNSAPTASTPLPKADRGHGSPYDRGTADSYYRRPPCPHRKDGWARVTDLTPAEVTEYNTGYADNEAAGSYKDFT